MKDIKDNVVIQIEVTNACNLACANCSRLVGHHKKPFFMSLDEVRNGIKSLNGFPGRIGLMGGEPTLHPEFSKICDIYQELIPDKRKRELWTDGFKWDKYKDKIFETFDEDLVHYNDHSKPEEGWHQPILVSIDEVVLDKKKMWRLIDNCWVQRRWSASITPKGAFFCEIARALDHVLDGPGGWDVEPGWWKKTVKDYTQQKKSSCLNCSASLPMHEIPNNHHSYDYCSSKMLEKLSKAESPKVRDGRVKEMEFKDATGYLNSVSNLEEGDRGYWKSHPDWRPSEFRTKVWHGPGEGDLTSKEVASLQRQGLSNLKNKTNHIADTRTEDMFFSKEARKFMRSEMDISLVDAIQECTGDLHFSEEASLISLIEASTKTQLTKREKDLIIKYACDPAFR